MAETKDTKKKRLQQKKGTTTVKKTASSAKTTTAKKTTTSKSASTKTTAKKASTSKATATGTKTVAKKTTTAKATPKAAQPKTQATKSSTAKTQPKTTKTTSATKATKSTAVKTTKTAEPKKQTPKVEVKEPVKVVKKEVETPVLENKVTKSEEVKVVNNTKSKDEAREAKINKRIDIGILTVIIGLFVLVLTTYLSTEMDLSIETTRILIVAALAIEAIGMLVMIVNIWKKKIMTDYKTLNKIIKNSKYLVFFGGAGVSTESGIPDFRSKNGIYNSFKGSVPAEVILSRSFFDKYKEEFFKFYFDNLVNTNVLPNITHKRLVELENAGILKAIITQNIDGLHEKAGSSCVLNLHGTIYKNHCMNCNKFYSLDKILRGGIPKCDCGGIIKPDVTLYEEALDDKVMEAAISHISQADTLIVAGTSLSVYPAAGLVNYFKGKNLIIINKDKIDLNEGIFINEYLGEVFNKIKI